MIFNTLLLSKLKRWFWETPFVPIEMTFDELAISYYDLIAKNTELTQKVEEQVKEIAQLQDEKFDNLAHIS